MGRGGRLCHVADRNFFSTCVEYMLMLRTRLFRVNLEDWAMEQNATATLHASLNHCWGKNQFKLHVVGFTVQW